MTFLGSDSLVFSVPWKLFLTKKNQYQKICRKLFLRKEKLISPATLFLQEMLINIKTCHFHSSINHPRVLFHWTCITSSFCPLNITKFLRTAFFQTSRDSYLQMFFKISVLKSFENFTGKHSCWRLFLEKHTSSRPATFRYCKKDFKTGVFLWGLWNFF